MPTLRELLSCFDVEEGLLLPDSWRQGRTAYGGIVSALGVAAAMQRHAGALPPLRSMQVTFIGPAAGLLRFMPTVLREGRSVVNVGVDVYADEDEALAARLSLVFGRARESAIAHDFGGELRPGGLVRTAIWIWRRCRSRQRLPGTSRCVLPEAPCRYRARKFRSC